MTISLGSATQGHLYPEAPTGVLLVEDDQDIRETLRQALEDEGYDVQEAEDGIEALHALRESLRPLVVVLDVRMPRLTGDQLLARIDRREHLPARHAFLLVTANREQLSPASLHLLKRMDVSVTPKPFDLNDMLDRVAHAARMLAEAEEQPSSVRRLSV